MRKQRQKSTVNKDASQQQLADRIRDSARQIWLAGLGAYNKAEEDAGKIFERLVHEGEEIEKATRGVVERQFKVVEDRVGDVREKASEGWGKLESLFDQRVASALHRLGIPTHRDVQELTDRVRALEQALSGAAPAKPGKKSK